MNEVGLMLKEHQTVQVAFLRVEKWLLLTRCRALAARHPANTVTKTAVKCVKIEFPKEG